MLIKKIVKGRKKRKKKIYEGEKVGWKEAHVLIEREGTKEML